MTQFLIKVVALLGVLVSSHCDICDNGNTAVRSGLDARIEAPAPDGLVAP